MINILPKGQVSQMHLAVIFSAYANASNLVSQELNTLDIRSFQKYKFSESIRLLRIYLRVPASCSEVICFKEN